MASLNTVNLLNQQASGCCFRKVEINCLSTLKKSMSANCFQPRYLGLQLCLATHVLAYQQEVGREEEVSSFHWLILLEKSQTRRSLARHEYSTCEQTQRQHHQ